MKKMKQGRGALAVMLFLAAAGSFAASPQRAFADGDKGKDAGKIPIIVQKPIITNDGPGPKQPAPPPKKKS